MKVHFVGVGGSGISAACGIAASYGFEVSGCDRSKESEYLGSLTREFPKIPVFYSHSDSHLKGIDLLAVSPAVLKFDPSNSELVEALRKKIPILTWQEFMGKFLQRGKFVIGVAGTHGKSTVTAMIGHILEEAGLDPTVEVGAIDKLWKSNFKIGSSKFFVCEADEYNNNFLNYCPNFLVVTNVEMDHPDYFKDTTAILNSFQKLVSQLRSPRGLFLGRGEKSELLKRAVLEENKKVKIFDHDVIDRPRVKVLGKHNLSNALLAASVAKALGVDEKVIKKSILNFRGVLRRLDYRGEIKGAKIFDDFAHHPTEVEASLSALRDEFPARRLLVVFEPHTYSRTIEFLSEFGRVFQKYADEIVLVDIFPAREVNTNQITSKILADKIGKKAVYTGSLQRSIGYVNRRLRSNLIVVFMGAGKIYQAYGMLKGV